MDVRQGNARLGRRADRPDIRGDLRPEIRAPSRELQRRHRRLLHLVGRGSRVLARRPQGGGRISAQARGATDTCGPGCQLRADRGLPPCRANAGVRQAAARLPPEPAWPIRAARIHPRRHFQSRLGSNLHRRTPRTRNLTSVRASRSMSGWDGPVASRSLAVRPRCLGCARGCRQAMLSVRWLIASSPLSTATMAAAISKCASSPMVPSLRVSR
ncbi:hypothetical protein J921_4052 [Acinetobacter baumannii 25493_8]|nr:hypothetical protein J921_4052 [Acinetobacter baumannii 25493_8]